VHHAAAHQVVERIGIVGKYQLGHDDKRVGYGALLAHFIELRKSNGRMRKQPGGKVRKGKAEGNGAKRLY
jgi:hypothetical protein